MDSAGDGGRMDPLASILPHLDFYVPNEAEAANQTGRSEPRGMIQSFREAGAKGWLGIKLGAHGALLSPRPGEFIDVSVVKAPAKVVDTTGAGDCFYGRAPGRRAARVSARRCRPTGGSGRCLLRHRSRRNFGSLRL